MTCDEAEELRELIGELLAVGCLDFDSETDAQRAWCRYCSKRAARSYWSYFGEPDHSTDCAYRRAEMRVAK